MQATAYIRIFIALAKAKYLHAANYRLLAINFMYVYT